MIVPVEINETMAIFATPNSFDFAHQHIVRSNIGTAHDAAVERHQRVFEHGRSGRKRRPRGRRETLLYRRLAAE